MKITGFLCLTTPNGDFVNCYEENWETIKDQKERNEKLANSIGNHVCEFTLKELKQLVKEAGFTVLVQEPIVSARISKKPLLRWILPERLLWSLDRQSSASSAGKGKLWGKLQVVLAQRAD